MKGLELKELHCDQFQRNANIQSCSDYALQRDNPRNVFNDCSLIVQLAQVLGNTFLTWLNCGNFEKQQVHKLFIADTIDTLFDIVSETATGWQRFQRIRNTFMQISIYTKLLSLG